MPVEACSEYQICVVAMKPHYGGWLMVTEGRPTCITPALCLRCVHSESRIGDPPEEDHDGGCSWALPVLIMRVASHACAKQRIRRGGGHSASNVLRSRPDTIP